MIKARENIELAQYIIDVNKSPSFASFHAQQCVELSIKALSLQSGFEDFLKKRKFNFYTHDALQILVETMDEYIKSDLSDDKKDAVKKYNEAFKKNEKHFKGVKKQSNAKFQETWLISLGQQTTPTTHITSSGVFKHIAYEMFVALKLYTLKSKNEFKNEFKKMLKNKSIPETIINYIIAQQCLQNEKHFKNFIENLQTPEKYLDEIIDVLITPNKIFAKVKILDLNFKRNIETFYLTYLMYLTTVAKYLYPHEMMSKYPREINFLNKNSEDVYNKRKNHVILLVTEADFVFKRLEKICNLNYKITLK